MGFKDILGILRDRMLPRRRAASADQNLSPHERLVRDYDLHLVELHDEIPRLIPQRDAMRAAWRRRDFLAYHQAFEAARQADGIAENGKPHYSLVKEWFLDEFLTIPDDDDAGLRHETLLEAFEGFFRQHPSPFSAATYADALRMTAFTWRGTEYGHDVRQEQWQKYEAFLLKADEVLDSCPGPDDFAWRISDYRRAANDGSIEEFQERFEAAWAQDRYNIDLCRSHARMIMPRWLGRDEHDLEVFARSAAELTKDRFGLGFYALIQQANTEVGDHELAGTLCDPALVKQGFEDLLARFPAPSLVNYYADMLEWMEDKEALADLLQSRFRTIVPQIWYGDTREEKIAYAFDTLLEAAEVVDSRAA
ncbi:hypothetical protein [Agrobacterium sp. NPDC090283]|uniref:hypothetical protein n=1 Tax=Agrobacterium sp. NPDC090283 TaxID=3363920 RepID=UPI00383B04AE